MWRPPEPSVQVVLLLGWEVLLEVLEELVGLGRAHALELLEEVVGRETLVTGGAGIVAAQRHAAELGILVAAELLGGTVGRHLVPEILEVLGAGGAAAVGLRGGAGGGGRGERGECESGDSNALNLVFPHCDRRGKFSARYDGGARKVSEVRR